MGKGHKADPGPAAAMGREGTLLPRAPSSPALGTARDAEMKDEVIFGHSQKEGARCGLCALDSLLWAHPGGCHTLTALKIHLNHVATAVLAVLVGFGQNAAGFGLMAAVGWADVWKK